MKIKTSFVTNSSSTSFVGWGLDLSGDDNPMYKNFIKTILKDYKKEIMDIFPKASLKYFEQHPMDLMECFEFLKSELLEFSLGPELEHFFIAAHPIKMKNNETLLEFKQDIVSELERFGIKTKIENLIFIEEEWFDG